MFSPVFAICTIVVRRYDSDIEGPSQTAYLLQRSLPRLVARSLSYEPPPRKLSLECSSGKPRWNESEPRECLYKIRPWLEDFVDEVHGFLGDVYIFPSRFSCGANAICDTYNDPGDGASEIQEPFELGKP